MTKSFLFKQLLVMAILLFVSTYSFAYDFAVDGIFYNKLSENTVEVTYKEPGSFETNWVSVGYEDRSAITIPSTVEYNKVSYNVISIGNSTFIHCGELKTINLPNSLVSIGDSAFCDCGLTKMKISDCVTSIGNYAFFGCEDLSEIILPDGLTSIGKFAFCGCISLTAIVIPDKVTSIEEETFEGCKNLTSVTIGKGVTSIGINAFWDCSSLESIYIPDGVSSLTSDAFWQCYNMKSITVGENNEVYRSYNGVLYSKDLTKLILCPTGFSGDCVIPDETISLENGAFRECSKVTSVTMGKGVTTIGYYAFSYCSNMVSINIPEGVTYIKSETFNHCTSLSSIVIPDAVTSIGDYAFENCSSLKSVTIGRGVSFIGYQAFIDCGNLKEIVCKPTTPPLCENPDDEFLRVKIGDCTLYVPDGATEYATTAPWKDFNIVYGIPNTGIMSAKADRGVIVSSNGNQITVSGTVKGEKIVVYNVGGSKIKEVKASDGNTTISGLQSGNVYVVKIGGTKVKVAM